MGSWCVWAGLRELWVSSLRELTRLLGLSAIGVCVKGGGVVRNRDGEGWATPGVASRVAGRGLAGDLALVSKSIGGLQSRVEGMIAAVVGPDQMGGVLVELTRLQARLQATLAQVAAYADAAGVGDEVGARSAALWWANQCRVTRGEAVRTTRLGADLQVDEFEPTRQAFVDGELLADQARVIVQAIGQLPAGVDPRVRAEAQRVLIGEAAHHDAKGLRVLGRRVLEVVDPATADAHEARLLAGEEARAAAKTYLVMTDDGQGCTRGRFTLPSLQGAMLRKALHAIAHAQPSTSQSDSAVLPEQPCSVRRLTPQRLGQAFGSYVERFPAHGLPTTGGVNASVVVTMSYETLVGGLRVACTDTGEYLSAGQARRLACEAGIIPVVLGGRSEVLDVGRTRRFYTRAQRVALGLRDGGCTVQGCVVPAAKCHAHHDAPWVYGGATSLANGRLLCPRHHTLIHSPDYQTRIGPNNKITLTRNRQ
jgi:hypothetical protein